jgi:hypothetical protein
LYDSTCLSVIKFSSTSSVLVFQNCPIRTLYILIIGLIGCFLSTRTKIVSFAYCNDLRGTLTFDLEVK